MKLMVQLISLFAIFANKVIDARSIKQSAEGKRITFEDVIMGTFAQRTFNGAWVSGDEFTYIDGGNFKKFNVEFGTEIIILEKEFLDAQKLQRGKFELSPDETKVIVRFDFHQDFFVDPTQSKCSVVTLNPEPFVYEIADGADVGRCIFSPTGNFVAYDINKILYIIDTASTVWTPRLVSEASIYSVVYPSDTSYYFSSDSRFLAFATVDDSKVESIVIDYYGEGDLQYPQQVRHKYPKPGTDIQISTLNLFELETLKTVELKKPTKILQEHLIGSIFWIDNQKFGAIWMNRRQNYGIFVSYDVETYEMEEIMELNEPDGWLNPFHIPKCDNSSVCYLVDNFKNWPTLTSVDTKNKQDVKRLSSDGMTVTRIYGVHNGNYFYESTPSADQPYNRHTYSNDGCLTCYFETPELNMCSEALSIFSKDFSHYVMTCSGPDPSFIKFYRTDGNMDIYLWEEHAEIRTKLTEYALPQIKFLRFPVAGNFSAVVKMILPPEIDFEGSSTTEIYPMQLYVDGEPASVTVLNKFDISMPHYQVSSKNMIYVEIDGRGTAHKGVDMMFSVNNNLGTYEIEDFIAVTKYLIDKFKFIDASRIGIWGHSYGGYATAMTLAKDVDHVFKCGFSAAPVTSWRLYASIFTERFMGLDANGINYYESDVTLPKYIEQIGKHEFFLIHGSFDDNVPYQHSMLLAKELQKNDILFDQLTYVDEDHKLSNVMLHIFHTVNLFWDKCFKK